jgi:hypothetical protein
MPVLLFSVTATGMRHGKNSAAGNGKQKQKAPPFKNRKSFFINKKSPLLNRKGPFQNLKKVN